MKTLLRFAHGIDWLTDRFAFLAKWAVGLACAICAGNAFVRYGLDYSSNAFLEIQWYMFAVIVMFGAAQVLRVNEHVRVDIFYGMYPSRGKVYVDLFGMICFLLPVMILVLYLSLPIAWNMYVTKEMSSNAGGLIRWPVMLTIPLGMLLLILQAVAEIIKRVAWLRHEYNMDTHYERPLQ